MSAPKSQPSTIRRQLRRWFAFFQVALVLVGILAYSWHDNGYNHTFRIVALSLLMATVLGLFASGFRCPRCRKSLVPQASKILADGGRFACPKCGGSIDESMVPPSQLG